VHDTVWFEINDKPSVFVASSEFMSAAEAQSRSLGLPQVKRVFVPHPIQDRTDAEMRERAEAVAADLIEALVD
jgi:hypothetical protein